MDKAINGHVLDILPTFPEASARCCITSPPYWGLRDYGTDPVPWPEVTFSPMAGLPPMTIPAQVASLGLEPDPWAFVGHLVQVFREVRRVLTPDGSLWLNLGDSYAATTKGSGGLNGTIGNGAGQGTNAGSLYESRKFDLSSSGLKPKDLLGIPWRVAFALQADGWWLRSDVIWSKPNPMPESVTDRPTKAHEYVFLLARSDRYFFGQEAVREKWADERCGNPGSPSPKVACIPGQSPHTLGTVEWKSDGLSGRNVRSVWTIPTEPCPDAHFAVMPSRLVERCILAGSEVDDTVLDPFAGAGTTLATARRLGRKGIGCELNPKYIEIQERRIDKAGGYQVPLLGVYHG